MSAVITIYRFERIRKAVEQSSVPKSTYSQVAALPITTLPLPAKRAPLPHRESMYTLIIVSNDKVFTGEQIVDIIRNTVNAIRVSARLDRLRKT
ncbi:hypothetical protein EVAR_57896_1 [Eumeta japonica]|uniref:Uncharacterized protein n=1 Tax=Eumeta variegata TaxID=151549 RepID=A0A4C1YX73_EUMVA|nr:hypothetical protein EVAR_57896_1 [Eumeta japonica]